MGENNDSIANAVGKGPALILTVDGEDYILAPLKMEDMADVEIEAKGRHKADVLDTIRAAGDLLTSEQRLEMIKELSTEFGPWEDFLATPSGAEYVLMISLRNSYPEMSVEKARSLMTVEAIAQILPQITALVGIDAFMGEVGAEGEGDASPPETG